MNLIKTETELLSSTKKKQDVTLLEYHHLNTNTCSGIQSWYCTCKNGTRTVGCCSHIASIIYYFSLAKYLDNLADPAGFLRD